MTTGREPPTRVSLVLADVDGTLVTHEKVLTERAIRAVQGLHQRGIPFAITSGRPPKGMSMLFDPLAIATPIAGFNGGLFVNRDLSEIESRTLPRHAADAAVETIRQHGLDVWVYSGEDWLVGDNEAPHVAREQWTVKFPPKVTRDFGAALDRAVKIVGVSDDLDRVKQAEAAVQERLGEGASAARSQPYYLDVTHPQANKGGVVDYLVGRFGFDAKGIVTLGDQPNDVLMFRKSGFSIAMGNAHQDVQDKADRVCASCDEEGFAIAIETYVLREPA